MWVSAFPELRLQKSHTFGRKFSRLAWHAEALHADCFGLPVAHLAPLHLEALAMAAVKSMIAAGADRSLGIQV